MSSAVVVDKEYLADEYNMVRDTIEEFLTYAKREIIKHGGVNVQFYSWTRINIKRGESKVLNTYQTNFVNFTYSDITAIFSIASCQDTWRLFKAASDENILHIAISETDCPRMPVKEAFTVPLLKLGEELPQLLLDIRTSKILEWPSAIILYDSILKRDMVTRVVSTLTKESSALKNNAAISLIKLETNSSAADTRLAIKETFESLLVDSLGSHYLAIVTMDTMETVMDIASDMGLVTPINQWLYIIPDANYGNYNISTVQKFMKEGDNLAFIYNATVTSPDCTGGIICHVKEILEAFTRSLEIAILDEYELASQISDEEWEAIRPTKSERRHSILYNIKAHLSQFGVCDNCTTWKLQAAETWGKEYPQGSTSSKEIGPQLLYVGSWRPSDGSSMVDELFPHVAHGFRGRSLPLITFHNPPWQILRLNDSGLIEHGGIVFDIIKELSNSLNFTYTIEVINFDNAKNASSKLNSLEMTDLVTNHIPDKILYMVRNRQVAFGAAAFTVTDASKNLINFTMQISTQSYTFLVARPKELSRALLFMSPFKKDTWLCLAAAIVSMGPILYYIHKFSPVCEYKGVRLGGLSSIQNCIWYMYGALLQQGGMHMPYADSARIIVGAWWLVVLVVATTYCGNLVAFLTFPKIDNPIATLDDLLDHRDTVSWSMTKGSFLETQLKSATEDKYQALYRGSTGMDAKAIEMLPLIQEGKHIFIDWKIRLQYIMRKQYLLTGKCNLALGADEFFDEKIALVVPQGTPYLPKINVEIKRLHQNGLIGKWLKDYLPKRDKCFKVRHVAEVNNHTVNMDDMQGSFFVLIFGFLLALGIIMFEKFWYKYMLKRDKKIILPYTS
ncbi:PREDICTED: glutamate receptor ionotropic, delta-2 [Nicrophorus vespilloides]|uniref:Glutamate receptor ionotropic, delta-2 n=1 Tax=Nicrophorus vespilloides TaxID=110193 RepID=A0ABM1MW92_NICVS|nr:PREDICTED: glutamate receptor ionotropic, delta-2 [Nicrophorus vespilloides]